jgi:ATP-dependent DNA helicase 2 subunit 1
VTNSVSIEASSAGGGISLLSSLISNVNSKQVPKRALFSNLPFEIGPGFKISVKGYNILQRQKPARSCYIWLNGEKAQIAKGETIQMAEDTTKTVLKTEVKKAYKFGGEQVLFTKEEQKELKNFGAPGLRIIGFKPQSMLPAWASVNKSTFIYPSEEDYVGSTRVFSAFWQKLLKDKKMGLAWYIARTNANPQVVALLPSEEHLDESTKQQITPAGIWLYPLPYADDIRQPNPSPAPIISPDELTDKMRTVMQQLQLPGGIFDASKYPNPALQWHYRILQAIALDEEIPEFKDGDDKTVPKYRQIHKRAGPYVVDWGMALEEESRLWVKEHGGRSYDAAGAKRVAGEAKEGPAKKAKLTSSGGDEDIQVLMKKFWDSGKVGSATVVQLKEFCTASGLSTGGKKGDLVARVEELLESK